MLLATDLDGTFLGGSIEARLSLYQLIAARKDIQLVFVTGRGIEVVLPLLSDPTIPVPDYIIADVGASVVDGRTLQPVAEIQESIDMLWPGEWAVAEALEHITALRRQEVPQERRCSFFCEAHHIDDEVRRIVSSLDCDMLFSDGKYFDVLPKNVNKGSTLEKLLKHLGTDPDQVLVAGDTLNDLAMLRLDYKGVCVGKSERELLDVTRGTPNTYHASAAGAGGIIEAIGHYGLLPGDELKRYLEDNEGAAPGTSDLVIVYHRLPFEEYIEEGQRKRRQHTSPNGIIPTLLSFFAKGRQGSWVAWSLESDDATPVESHSIVDKVRYPNLRTANVPLSTDDVDVFYKRFSKEAFWPTLHTFWERARFDEDHWETFLAVNERFAQHAAAESAAGATVWLHDYNLWMVPAFLREMRPDLTIAFFHHTYFPSADAFNVLPWRKQIVGSLLQCDYIGFHIPRQSENFVDVAQGVMPLKITRRANCAPRFLTYGCALGLEEMVTEVEVLGRKVGLGAHPVGLDLDRIRSCLKGSDVADEAAELRDELGDTRMILSVERLDYTKGILEKLRAYERLLKENPALCGKITLVTICVPAAAGMAIYDELQNQIEQTVGHINGRFGRFDWTPVKFFFRAMPFEKLVVYYSVADVMWITPLRDGLNLVAKEFMAVQGLTGGHGVLVLSEFAGAAAELRGPILTNPHDPSDLVSTVYQALNMSREEAVGRVSEAFEGIQYFDLKRWSDDFMAAVNRSAQ